MLEDRAKITIGNATSSLIAGTLGNDNNLKYIGSDFERGMNHLYQALNYLKVNKLDSALVEIRAASNVQKMAAANREGKLFDAQSKISQYKFSPNIAEALTESQQIVRSAKSKFLNPYIFYVSGNLRELKGDYNSALVEYKNALELNPNNKYILQDVLRLSKIYDPSTYLMLKNSTKVKEITQQEYDNSNTILVIYEQDFVPSKSSIPGAIYIDGKVVSISLPAYLGKQGGLNNVNVVLSNPSKEIVGKDSTMELGNIFTLAHNDLAEKYSGILLRQITRIVSKIAVQNQMQNDTVALLSGIAMALTENADLRSFRTLPSYVQVAKINTPQDFDSLEVTISSVKNVKVTNLKLKKQEVAIIYIIDTGGYVYSNIIYKSKKM
ncbi:hypothetical protein ABSA28_00111 [Candidatus Hepatincolaceae symbiont of Richtersius coronifer]